MGGVVEGPSETFRIRRTPYSIEVEIRASGALDRYFERIYEELKGMEFPAQPPSPQLPPGGAPQAPAAALPPSLPAGGEDLPSEIPRPAGTEDAIIKILGTPWGRAKMRTWGEIQRALEHCGYQFSGGAIRGALTGLFSKGRVRRQRIGRAFVYGLPLT